MGARDFAVSLRFYEALGCAAHPVGDGLVLLELGGSRFYLQDHYVKDWIENSVLVVIVEDPQAWHDHVASVLADGDFGDARVAPPRVEPWGATVTYCWDPSGVLLQIMRLDG